MGRIRTKTKPKANVNVSLEGGLTPHQKAALTKARRRAEQDAEEARLAEIVLPPRRVRPTAKGASLLSVEIVDVF